MRFMPLFILFLLLFSCNPARAIENPIDSGMQAGEEMIVNAFSRILVYLANGMLTGLGGVETGKLNNSENYTGEQVAIFAIAAHSIDPTQDPVIMQEVENTKQVYSYGMKLFALLLTLFMLFQQLWPSKASHVVGTFRGQPGYVTIDEMAEYYITVGLWFLIGPSILYGALFLNNYLTQSLTLSVLDHVAFSSQNEGFFLFMVFLWSCMAGFFAVRIVLILLAVKAWYLFGLALAVKKFRWISVVSIPYILGYVFAQFVIVWIVVSVIIYTDGANWLSSGLSDLGLFLVVTGTGLLFVFWPLIWKLLSPSTFKNIVTIARFV